MLLASSAWPNRLAMRKLGMILTVDYAIHQQAGDDEELDAKIISTKKNKSRSSIVAMWRFSLPSQSELDKEGWMGNALYPYRALEVANP
ncbi:unnamed protein product [Linum trigynum]|uniref:Uncharacterized protein n=1 Tax=Linum trigynum TaxID=586398 RepID=A0AAV2E3R7_9ROSI